MFVEILLFDLNATSRAGGVGRCRQPLRGDCEGIVTHALNQLSEAAEGWRGENLAQDENPLVVSPCQPFFKFLPEL